MAPSSPPPPSTTQAFTIGPPDDLVSPRVGSKTSRALVSFAQRSLFEARHALGRALHPSSEESVAIALYLEVVAGMLPGRPHAIARSLRDPAVFVPARALLNGDGDPAAAARAFVGSACFWLELEGALDVEIALPFATRALALGHGVVAEGAGVRFGRGTARRAIAAVEGRLLALESEGPWFDLGLAAPSGNIDAPRVLALREALAFVSRFARAERDDLDRVAVGFVCGTRNDEDRPLGLVFVSGVASLADDVRAILGAVVTEKLALLRLSDPIATPLPPLRAMCVRFVYHRTCLAARRVSAGSDDEAIHRAAISAITEDLRRFRAIAEVTEVGMGVVSELEHGLAALT